MASAPDRHLDHARLYAYRFAGVDQESRQRVWNVIAPYVYEAMGSPRRVLDPAAGRCEFMRAIPAAERWIVDEVAYPEAARDGGMRVLTCDVLDAELPAGYFDGVFVSNFLEHLQRQDDVARFLGLVRDAMAPGGRIAVLGPNFKYCAKEYFDCADHTLALTHVSVAEHLYAAGFEVERVVPRFLPYSFRGLLPPSPRLTAVYLKMPFFWRLLGKQFLLIGKKPA